MNVLPLVSAFILIFAICSYTFFHNVCAAVQERSHYIGSHRIVRKFANHLQTKLYIKLPGENLHGSERKKSPSSTFISPRDRFNLAEEAKFNITPLFIDRDKNRKEAIFLELIKSLYEFTSIYTPGLENELLEALKNNPKIESFNELLTYNPSFYKMIKGTNNYKLSSFKGYPALGDFLTIEKNPRAKMINFSCAARPVLEALFGKVFAPKIINEEKHKWEIKHKHSPLTKQELNAFLLTKNKNFTEYWQFIHFRNKKKARSNEVFQDAKTKIQIKIPNQQ